MKFTNNKHWKDYPCYCHLHFYKPYLFEKENIPQGYCGYCKECGAPGHIRSHPLTSAYVGALCEKHFIDFLQTIPVENRQSRGMCYCFQRNYSSEIFKDIPEGYCGFCDICGKPGHIRTLGAFTGCWCDKHYDELRKSKA